MPHNQVQIIKAFITWDATDVLKGGAAVSWLTLDMSSRMTSTLDQELIQGFLLVNSSCYQYLYYFIHVLFVLHIITTLAAHAG